MTFNLRFGELASLEELAGFIADNNPDIVALQECDWKTNRLRAPHQNGKAFVNELAYHTGMFGLFGKAIDYAGGYYGIGILSKYPILRSERYLLPNPDPTKEQRALLLAEIELPDKSVITFLSTHLEFSTEEARRQQIKFINKVRKKIKTPVIIGGDFNEKPDGKQIREGFKQWKHLTDSTYTVSVKNPSSKIDYIYGFPAKKFTLLSTKVHTECKLSDHFPVSAQVVLKK